MKKLVFFAAVAAVLVVLVSCGGNSNSKTGDSDSDSIQYDYVEGVKFDHSDEKHEVLVLDLAWKQVYSTQIKRNKTITHRFINGRHVAASNSYGEWELSYKLAEKIKEYSSGRRYEIIYAIEPVDTACNFVRIKNDFIPAEGVKIKKTGEGKIISPDKMEEKVIWTFTTKDGQQYTQKGTIVQSLQLQ